MKLATKSLLTFAIIFAVLQIATTQHTQQYFIYNQEAEESSTHKNLKSAITELKLKPKTKKKSINSMKNMANITLQKRTNLVILLLTN